MRFGNLALLAGALLAGCGQNDTDPAAGGVTQGEARALDEAAEMLDEQQLPEHAPASPTPGPLASRTPEAGEAPAAEPGG